jgi:hypothetical protein
MTTLLRKPFQIALPFMAWFCITTSARCNPSQETLLATLGTNSIRQSDFTFFVQGMFAPDERELLATNAAARTEALEAYLDLRVLSAKARKDGIDKDTRFIKARELMEMKLLARMLTEQEREQFMRAATVTEPELKSFYDRYPDRYQIAPQFTVRQILVYVKGNPGHPEKGHEHADAAAKAAKALERLRAGESWDVVARECSDDVATGRRGGLMENAQFGYFPSEMEAAIRTQELGKPGDVVKSAFGYHVLQVEKRTLQSERQPLETVKELIANDVSNEKINAAHQAYLEPIRAAVNLKETSLASRDTFVLNPPGIEANAVLATINGVPVCEADFEWFARDAFRLEQREQAFSRPGARRGMVKSFLNMKALEARARQLKLHEVADFQALRSVEEMKLLGEFLQERDRTTPWLLTGDDDARTAALKDYMARLRTEMDFKTAAPDRVDNR